MEHYIIYSIFKLQGVVLHMVPGGQANDFQTYKSFGYDSPCHKWIHKYTQHAVVIRSRMRSMRILSKGAF